MAVVSIAHPPLAAHAWSSANDMRVTASTVHAVPKEGRRRLEHQWTDTSVLFVRWQRDGDRRAQAELVARFLPLARSLARRYAGASEPMDDLVQVASLGVVKAINRFDPERGTAFSSFAVPTILGELRRHLRDHEWAVRVPRQLQENALRVEHASHDLIAESGRHPNAQQLAQYLGWDVRDVWEALQASGARKALSLDDPGTPDGEEARSLIDTLGAEDKQLEQADAWLSLEPAMRWLSLRQREILRLRFACDLTQQQIAERIDVSQMQVSRIISSTLARVREVAEVLAREGSAIAPRPNVASAAVRGSLVGSATG